MEANLEKDERLSIDNVLFLIKKFQREGGFDGLALEDLAVAVAITDFNEHFKRHTGQDWATKYEAKALEKLRAAHFDMQWLLSTSQESHKPFFQFCQRGDVPHVKDMLTTSQKDGGIMDLKHAVDQLHKKSPLHYAAENGHTVLVEYLLMQGFNPNARDKLLRTPLHYAAMKGFEYVCDTLIKYGGNMSARDSSGRTAFHFACCSPSASLLTLFIGHQPEIVNAVDNSDLTGLHYAVLNSSNKQVEIVRTILENRGNVNARDITGKTPLYYAAEQGRTRVIPILLQMGHADITITDSSDTHTPRTPLDVAVNQRTRELLIVYSASGLQQQEGGGGGGEGGGGAPAANKQVRKEDIEWMNYAIKGQTYKKPPGIFDIPEGFTSVAAGGGVATPGQESKKKTDQPQQQQASSTQYPKAMQTSKNTMAALSRERFFEMMKTVQESGVKAFQHIKKPFIYTGSWMEGVQNLEDLYSLMSSISPTEACLCAFNLLCPYDKPLPQDQDQEVVDSFFGDGWKSAIQKPLEERMQREKQLQLQLSKMDEIQIKLEVKEKALKDKVEQVKQLTEQVQQLQIQVQEQSGGGGRGKGSKGIKELEETVLQRDKEIERLNKEMKDLKKQLIEKEMEIEFIKQESSQGTQGTGGGGNFQEAMQIREELRLNVERGKVQRFKAGQIFLRALQERGGAQQRKKAQQSSASPSSSLQDNLQDDEAIIKMFAMLQNNPPNYLQRLKEVDGNDDGRITQAEFMQYCQRLKLSQQDTLSLCRVVGFESAGGSRKLLGISEFQLILKNRPIERQQSEEKLFKKILDAIAQKNLSLEQLFKLMDTDGSGQVSSSEMRVGLANLKITLNQKDFNNIFCIFDKDKSDSISLEEMKQVLEEYEQKIKAGEGGGKSDSKNVVQQQQDQYKKQQEEEAELAYQKKMEAIWQEENKQFEREAEQVNSDDGQLLSGKLKIQITHIRQMTNLKSRQKIVFKLIMEGSVEDQITESLNADDQGYTNLATRMTVKLKKANELSDFFKAQIYSSMELGEDSYLGEVIVCWKACILNAEEFYINQEFSIVNQSYPSKKVSGYLGIQLRWTNETMVAENFPKKQLPIRQETPMTPQNNSNKRKSFQIEPVAINQPSEKFFQQTINENDQEDINSDINELISPKEQQQLLIMSKSKKNQGSGGLAIDDSNFKDDDKQNLAEINSDIGQIMNKSDYQINQEELDQLDSNLSDMGISFQQYQ